MKCSRSHKGKKKSKVFVHGHYRWITYRGKYSSRLVKRWIKPHWRKKNNK